MRRGLLVAAATLALVRPAAGEMFGPDYPPCGNQPSTLAIVDCVAAKTAEWDARLNAAYQDLMARAYPPQREPLRAAQRLRIQYRDANCGFYAAQEGTIRLVQAAECLRAMAQDRALELENAMVFE